MVYPVCPSTLSDRPDRPDLPLCQRLNEKGIGARPLSAYDPLTQQQGLILGYSAETADQMASSVSQLMKVYSQFTKP